MSLELQPSARIVHPRTSAVGRKIMGDTNADVNFCIDSKLANIRGSGKCSPGGSAVWGHYIGRSEEATEARLKGNGIRALTHHPNCGMAKVAAEKELGHPVSQADADQWAADKTRKFARKTGFGVIGIQKGELCTCPDNAHVHIIRPGVKNAPVTGFRINSITQDPVHAAEIARVVAKSRGETDVTTVIHSTSEKDAARVRARLQPGLKIEAVVTPRAR